MSARERAHDRARDPKSRGPIGLVTESLADLFRDPRHERRGNTVVVGAASILLVVVLFAASMALPQLWYVLRTEYYSAEFHNAGGLRAGDPVLVAGVPSGRVDSLSMDGGLAVVGFRLDRSQELGEASTATVGLKSILGNRFLEVVPSGGGDLGPGDRPGGVTRGGTRRRRPAPDASGCSGPASVRRRAGDESSDLRRTSPRVHMARRVDRHPDVGASLAA